MIKTANKTLLSFLTLSLTLAGSSPAFSQMPASPITTEDQIAVKSAEADSEAPASAKTPPSGGMTMDSALSPVVTAAGAVAGAAAGLTSGATAGAIAGTAAAQTATAPPVPLAPPVDTITQEDVDKYREIVEYLKTHTPPEPENASDINPEGSGQDGETIQTDTYETAAPTGTLQSVTLYNEDGTITTTNFDSNGQPTSEAPASEETAVETIPYDATEDLSLDIAVATDPMTEAEPVSSVDLIYNDNNKITGANVTTSKANPTDAEIQALVDEGALFAATAGATGTITIKVYGPNNTLHALVVQTLGGGGASMPAEPETDMTSSDMP